MKALTFTLLSLSFTYACTDRNACSSIPVRETPATVNKAYRVYTISCEGPKGWTEYKTLMSSTRPYGSRSGIWSFKTTEGNVVWATNCSAVIEARAKP